MKSGGGAVLLRLDFLTVLEDEADIVGAVDDGIFDKQLFIYMRKIQKRKSELIKSVSVALRFIRSSRGLGRRADVRWTSALRGQEWNGDFHNKQKCAWYIPGHCLPISKKERISFMVKNKVVIKERDA